jgi:hypothetical protein
MKRQIRTNAAAAIFDAARKLDTGLVLVAALSKRSSGHFAGSITVSRVASTDGVELRRVAI